VDLSQAHWRKASASTGSNGACVEVANLGSHAAVRDSKAPHEGAHLFERHDFAAFLLKVKSGAYDRQR